VTGEREPDGHFALLRRELRNGIITSDVLDTLRKVATAAELGALLRLEVTTAVFYRASDRRTPEEWVDEVLAGPDDSGTVVLDTGERPDTRPTIWYGVPLEGFSGRLVEERDRLKAQDDAGAGALQEVIKLLVNTLYGDLASRFFEVGNVVLANVITARARVAVWMMAKALGLRQTVTDGGFYTPSSAPFWTGKRPGLAKLSRMWDWPDRKRTRTFKPMGGRDWPPGVCPPDADAVAAEHVRTWWAPYGLELPFSLAHKKEHTFLAAAYWSKADHAFLLADGTTVYKSRGKEKERNLKPGETLHPRLQMLKTILEGGDGYPATTAYHKGGILKVGAYLRAQGSRGYEWLKALRPGDTIPPREYHARENNLHMPLDTEADWRRRSRRRLKHRGQDVPWFESWGPQGIAAMLQAMADDRLHPQDSDRMTSAPGGG
jgi:hypothetical protein